MIHRVERDQLRVWYLLANAVLQFRLNVAEENQSRVFRSIRKLRLKAGKDIQVRVERVRHIQIVFVTTEPTKCLSIRNALKVRSIDVVTREDLIFLRTEVAPHDADYSNIGKEARRNREVRR